MELIETSTFTKQITALLSAEDYRNFQLRLAADPVAGPLIKGGGEIRKVRVALDGRGKSGGARVIYYWAAQKSLIVLLCAYAKNVAVNLTPKQVAVLNRVVKEEFGDERRGV